ITIPRSNDRLLIHRFDVYEALVAAGLLKEVPPIEEMPADGALAPALTERDGVRLTEFRLGASDILPALCWAEDGKSFYCLEGFRGTLRRVGLDGFKELGSLKIGSKCAWLATSAAGLLVTTDQGELLIVDPDKLEIKKRYTVPNQVRVVSAPKLSVAVLGEMTDSYAGQSLWWIDLKKGKILGQHQRKAGSTKTVCLGHPVVTPDGEFVLTRDGKNNLSVSRFRIKGANVVFDDTITLAGERQGDFQLSGDGSSFVLPGARAKDSKAGTDVLSVANWKTP